jgi:hypothetical protein
MSKEAMQMALEALEGLLSNIRRDTPQLSGKSMGLAEETCVVLREALAAPQPQQPLTPTLVSELLTKAGYDAVSQIERADFINGLRHGEAAHGIKGKP